MTDDTGERTGKGAPEEAEGTAAGAGEKTPGRPRSLPELETETVQKTGKSEAYRRMRRFEQILREETDERHPMPRAELIRRMEGEGFHVTPNTLRDDFRDLRAAGADVHCLSLGGKRTGYYSLERELDYADFKALTEVVRASGTITEPQTESLLEKLEALASFGDRQKLRQTSRVFNTRKRSNEEAAYAMDLADEAILTGRKLRFQYWDDIYTDARGKTHRIAHPHAPGKTVEPYAHVVKDDKSYLLAWDPEAREPRSYRFDRMTAPELTDEPCGPEAQRLAESDIAAEMTSAFHMFSTRDTRAVTMIFPRHLLGALHDQFGEKVPMEELPDGRYRVRVPVQLSRQFYGWVAEFGGEVEIPECGDLMEQIEALYGQLDRRLHGAAPEKEE